MISAPPDAGIAGWFGKLPTLGDFASRRLPPAFVERWDSWLSEGLAAWRAQDAHWLDAYLQAPSRRFLLPPGVIGPTAWAGVLMPSVDQVGRYFPLTLAAASAALPATAEATQALLDWLLRLDDLAVDALHEDWRIEQLDAELQRLGAPEPAREAPPPGTLAQAVLDAQSERDAVLWLQRDPQGLDHLQCTAGLPPAPTLAALLAAESSSLPPPTTGSPS